MDKVRIAIVGYGNIGKGVEQAVLRNADCELVGVFTRRDPSTVKTVEKDTKAYSMQQLEEKKEEIDVCVICGGSATDLPEQTPKLAKMFHVVDSFDNHARIPDHFEAVDAAAKEGGHVAMISIGWDPGLFSLNRLLGNAILPQGKDYTFWGRGISQGHSDAIRRIEGVRDARQYTVPIPEALEAVRSGELPELTARQKHLRECYVVLEDGADPEKIEEQIRTMPNYFEPYDVVVHFVSQEELDRDHREMPHGGLVIRSGETGSGSHREIMEFRLQLDSNPEFTSAVMVAFARAAKRMAAEGMKGCKTIFDVPPAYLSAADPEELRRSLL